MVRETTFTIRVPTTVAVSDALMVKVADQQFAIPLAQIDRIVRVSPASLEQYFESPKELFEYEINVIHYVIFQNLWVINQYHV